MSYVDSESSSQQNPRKSLRSTEDCTALQSPYRAPAPTQITALVLIGAHSASDATFTGRIVSIADGDTVTLLDSNLQQHKIRLSGCAGAGLSGFLPFFRNWPGLYREGLVDGAEWRARRFEWL